MTTLAEMGTLLVQGAVLVGFHSLMEVTGTIPQSADTAMSFHIPDLYFKLLLASCILALSVLLLPRFAEEREAGAQCAHTISFPGGSTHC